jgi:DNA-binding NarL/FixJ family response regulator
VLALMAQGRSNGAIAEELVLSYGAVEKNVAAIFAKLDLPQDAAAHPPVQAVLRDQGVPG